jgi:hypothetical protein
VGKGVEDFSDLNRRSGLKIEVLQISRLFTAHQIASVSRGKLRD